MKRNCNRILSLLLMLSLVLGLLPGIAAPAEAATVNYKYSEDGKHIIYNWGHRGTNATFLSPNAEKFYQDNKIAYESLSALAGASSVTNVPTSDLYKALKQLMASNHTHITTYGETRSLYKYTDCQDSATVTKTISSFYSGIAIGPAWDSGATWNREHTWPNSKGDGDGENDIMMLRPTSVSENSSRGNTAYGESRGYYDPNSVSGGALNLHGDVARIMLYVYVRWGNTSRMWGSSGVMENVDVLLKWMEEDPVDTWELGRNDSVEAITGTRNVFVDYPELAFLMFNREVPKSMTTPSGKAASGAAGGNTPPATCQHKNTTTIAATNPSWTENGYTQGVYCKDCKKYISGHSTVAATGHKYDSVVTEPTATENGYTTHTCANCGHKYTDSIVEALGFTYTVTFTTPEGITAPESMTCNKNGITLPTVPVPSTDRECAFHGWSKTEVAETTTEPDVLKAGSLFIADADTELFPVYRITANGTTSYATAVTCGHSKTELTGKYRPSCSTPGYSGDTVCTACGTVVTAGAEVPAKGHDLNKVEEKPATMESTGIAAHNKCAACGKLFDDAGNQLKSSDLILDKLTEMPKAPEAPAEPMDIIPIAAGAAGLVAVLVGVIILVRRKKKDL